MERKHLNSLQLRGSADIFREILEMFHVFHVARLGNIHVRVEVLTAV
jgi:hypothetical protein